MVSKKLGKQRPIFDTSGQSTLSAAMALCVAHTCMLGGLTTPSRLCVPHGTDRREHCILSHTGTYRNVRTFHLAKVCPLTCSFVKVLKVPDHSRHLPMCVPQLQVLGNGFFLALSICCHKMVECCVRASGFSLDAMLMDRHRAPAMTRDSICFGVYVDGVCTVGCDRLESSGCHGGCEGDFGRCWLALF